LINDKYLGITIGGFITILVGIILLSALADSIELATTTSAKTNESIDITSTTNTVLNESVTTSSGITTTGNISVHTITFFGNDTVNTDHETINISSEVNYTKDGVVTVSQLNFSDAGPYNISYTYRSDATGSTAEDDLLTVDYFGASNMSTLDIGISVGSEVNFTTAGVITVKTLNFSDRNYNISYTYESDEYVKNETARTLIPITEIFYAIAILVAGVIMVFTGFKGMGIL